MVCLDNQFIKYLTSSSTSSSPHSPSSPKTPTFKPASESEISKILFNCPNKQCDSDPIPTWLLKECSALLVPTITNIVNLSLSSGNFHHTLKERVVKSRLSDHLTSNNLVNPHQSAYCKHHSTETALLYIHDHLINAIGSRKISCLCLLDLSAAFDTIDPIFLLAVFVSNATMISPPYILASVLSPKA